jgi:uncharacterized UPF0160 family protein
MPTPHRPLLVTHSGTFHLDDAFAYAVLRLALGLGEADRDHTLVRTRDEAVIAQGNRVKEFAPIRAKETGRNSHSASTWCGTITPVQARRRSVARVG